MSFKISTEKTRSQKSSVMKSPQTRLSKPGTGEPGRPFTRTDPGAARHALPALHYCWAAWQHPSPAARHAACSEALLP